MSTAATDPSTDSPGGPGPSASSPSPQAKRGERVGERGDPDTRRRDEARALARLARCIVPDSLGDLGLEIPLWHRLCAKIFALIGFIALTIIAAFLVAELSVQRHLRTQIVAESELLSHTIRNALHRAMLQDRRGDAYLIMQDIGREAGIEKIRMMDQDGLITFSTDRNDVGSFVDRRAEACSGCHAQDERLHRVSLSGRSRVFEANGHRVLGIVTPLYNEAACASAACHAHPPERKVLGVLDVTVSLARVEAETAVLRRWILAAAAAAAAVLGYAVWLFARRHVVQPVAALVQATRRVARDQLELEVPVIWKGEIGVLAASFNDMTRSLRTTKRQLETLMHHLEQEVQERTAALRSAQDQLVRTEKLRSLGKLSASIAHEINNPLAGIVTFAKLMIRTLEQGPVGEVERRTLVRQLELVHRESQRCTAIVRNLLDFARERPLQLKEVDVNAVVDEVFTLLGNQAAILGVEFVKESAPLPPVEADFGQLRQALVNIAMNAIEAMPAGGRLVVSTRSLPEQAATEIVFADSGRGIPAEVMQKIFDPFFTTKEKGTGLGLSVVYGIVERHKGQVSVESEPGKGTRFTIRLPLARK